MQMASSALHAQIAPEEEFGMFQSVSNAEGPVV